MTQTVTLPNGDTIDFPDDMSQDALNAAVSRHMAANAPATRPPNWSVDWKTGDVTLPQSMTLPQPVQDFENLAANEFSMAASPTLREQAPAEKARLGPVASTVADTLGYYASPTTLLNAVPVAGGLLAGGLHEGIKSRFEGDDWTTTGKKALIGAGTGLISTGAGRVLTSPSVVSKALDAGGTGLAATIAHSMFGQSPMAGYVGANMGREWMQPAVKWTAEKSGPLLSALRPYVAAAIQAPVLGAQPQQGWSQWITGQ